jgi:hypothetical protein
MEKSGSDEKLIQIGMGRGEGRRTMAVHLASYHRPAASERKAKVL